jgi:hypothetical protein
MIARLKIEIENRLLIHKKVGLIKELTRLFNHEIESYVPPIASPKYFEIWFYYSFDFTYVILGRENYVVNLKTGSEDLILDEVINLIIDTAEVNEEIINRTIQQCEFDFFSICWDEALKNTDKNYRGFLIEYGIIRGWDLNNRVPVDGELIGTILDKEGVINHY